MHVVIQIIIRPIYKRINFIQILQNKNTSKQLPCIHLAMSNALFGG